MPIRYNSLIKIYSPTTSPDSSRASQNATMTAPGYAPSGNDPANVYLDGRYTNASGPRFTSHA